MRVLHLVRKPLTSTVSTSVLQHGTGALNIDQSRIPLGEDPSYARNCSGDRGHSGSRPKDQAVTSIRAGGGNQSKLGRWPSNLILLHSLDCLPNQACSHDCPVLNLDAQSLEGGMHSAGSKRKGSKNPRLKVYTASSYHIPNSTGDMHRFGDEGGASRFFKQVRHQT